MEALCHEIAEQIRPLEYESYQEYFLIHTFKRGRSASGRVNLEQLRRREHGKYYSRVEFPGKSDKDTEDASEVVVPPSPPAKRPRSGLKDDQIRRRSSRLNQQPTEPIPQPKRQEQTEVQDLYELLVEKVPEPFRRSDWILSPKSKYIPERQMRTKPMFDSIKVHELVGHKRIRKVLSSFEGGVAGVRRTSWED